METIKQKATWLIELLTDEGTDPATKQVIRAWFWNQIGSEANHIALKEYAATIMPNMTPDVEDYRKYAELAARLGIRDTDPRKLFKELRSQFTAAEYEQVAKILGFPVGGEERSQSNAGNGSAPAIAAPERISVPLRHSFRRRWAFRAAAVLLPALIVTGIGVLWMNQNAETPEVAMISESSAAGQMKQITLPDGSTVELSGGSEIVHEESFVNGRSVNLTGEAMFRVVRADNASGERLPFTVLTGSLTVDVYGTVFRVSDTENSNESTVALYEGSVGVGADSVVTKLTHGEMLSYNEITKEREVTLIPASEMSDNGFRPTLRFNDASLSELLLALRAYYDVNTIVAAGIDTTRGGFTGNFENYPMDNILNVLTRTNKALTFALKDEEIHITNK